MLSTKSIPALYFFAKSLKIIPSLAKPRVENVLNANISEALIVALALTGSISVEHLSGPSTALLTIYLSKLTSPWYITVDDWKRLYWEEYIKKVNAKNNRQLKIFNFLESGFHHSSRGRGIKVSATYTPILTHDFP